MNPLFNIIIGYASVLVMGFLALSFLTGGFLTTFLQVKMSRGKKVLIQIRSVTRDYFKTGIITEGFLVYKHKGGEYKRLIVPENSVYRILGVHGIMVDEERNAVALLDYSAVRGFDAVKWDNLLKRALYRPSILDQKQQIVLILLIVILLALAVVGLFLYRVNGNLELLIAARNAAAVI